MHQAFVEKVLRFRMLIIIATVALIIVASQGLDKVVVLSDYKSFIDPDYPELLRLEEIDDIFSENNA